MKVLITKSFTKGFLANLKTTETMTFVNERDAKHWMSVVNKNNLDYIVTKMSNPQTGKDL